MGREHDRAVARRSPRRLATTLPVGGARGRSADIARAKHSSMAQRVRGPRLAWSPPSTTGCTPLGTSTRSDTEALPVPLAVAAARTQCCSHQTEIHAIIGAVPALRQNQWTPQPNQTFCSTQARIRCISSHLPGVPRHLPGKGLARPARRFQKIGEWPCRWKAHIAASSRAPQGASSSIHHRAATGCARRSRAGAPSTTGMPDKDIDVTEAGLPAPDRKP